MVDLAMQFEKAYDAKYDLRKAYEKCIDISQENHAQTKTFLNEESSKDYEMHNALFRKAEKIKEPINAKFVWLHENYK